MKLYVVVADDHDYDAMTQWVVGVFTDYDNAEAAGKADEERYRKHHNETFGNVTVRMSHNYDITEVTLNEILEK
jgi:hypothetical protein